MFDHVEAATLHVTRRYIRRIDPSLEISLGRGRGVMIGGGFVVTAAHTSARPGAEFPYNWIDLGDLWLLRRPRPLELGSTDTVITVSRMPPESSIRPSRTRVLADGALALAGPLESSTGPCFVDPCTDLALLVVDRDATAALSVAIRRTPLVEPEPVYLFAGERGWVCALAIPKPGPHVLITDIERKGVLAAGDCGAAAVDENGEIVTIVNTLADDSGGMAGQLCLSLPPWALARIAA